MDAVIEIIKYTLPLIVVFIGMYFVLQSFFEEEENKKKYELKRLNILENRKLSLPLRLQAYERVILFLERIHPFALIQRVKEPEMNVADFNLALTKTIRLEYEYNLSQQIYINNDCWLLVQTAKEETLKIINALASELPPETPSAELSKAIINYFVENDKPIHVQIAINYIKDDVKNLF